MKPLTTKQKTAIRLHWAPYTLRFKADGSVMARKSPGAAWGLLYTPRQAEAHAACLI
jgi:hypothetical protein